eukprot:c1554_g1_i1.p1 GENE.c1554_g1_i1~~c1554_g1_i1.p1  ORF type:complete len:1020 (-),score=254.89 c1554_g1_i1:84-3095(-)
MATAVLAPTPPQSSAWSARSVLALLEEPDTQIKSHALRQLGSLVDLHWTEVSESLPMLESLFEDDTFADRELAALIASKVFYHLGEFTDALNYALGAGALFDAQQHSEYVDTMVSKAIDVYILQNSKGGAAATPIDPRLESIVNKMFDRCFASHRYKQALGIALECHRLDMVKRAVSESGNGNDMLAYCFRLCSKHVRNRAFRQQAFEVIVELQEQQSEQDLQRLAMCLMLLDRSEAAAKMLNDLVSSDQLDNILTAYQVAFDLVDNATQEFLLKVLEFLPQPKPTPSSTPAASSSDQAPSSSDTLVQEPATAPMAVDQSSTNTESTSSAPAQVSEKEQLTQVALERLRSILAGHITVRHNIDFLHRHCASDLQILKNIKSVVEARSSALYTSLVSCNAIMHAGTTNDSFLRINMDWLRQARNWAKFSVIGSLGLIRHGQLKDGMALLRDFLPQRGAAAGTEGSGGKYQEGGALYALGLINAEHGSEVVPYLLESLKNAGSNDAIQHGACLGLGLAAFATSNQEVYEELKTTLFTDNTVAGEAAGLAMGLVMCGSGNEAAIAEMMQYAHETQKEKIIRSLGLGMALVMYGREEGADTLIEQMLGDKDHLIRYGGMFLVALAYAATADNGAIRRLLHVAVSDVSDDVRRAAVLSLGFVLASEHQECPKVVSLLAESFNPHVRYGAAMAVGISCAGTGLKEAVDLLMPMTKDSVDFVRQSAHLSLAMVLIQVSEAQNPVVKEVREQLHKIVQDKHEETLAKIGAIMALGIIDAGGRNATISLCSDSGFTKMGAMVGMAVFLQFWYWFPLTSFIGLAIKPTCVVAVNSELLPAKMSFTSKAPASMFAYPPPVTVTQVDNSRKGPKAVLSTTKKQMAKEKSKEPSKGADAPDQTETKVDVDMKDASEAPKDEKPATTTTEAPKEEQTQVLENPARVTPSQRKYIEFVLDQRYQPVNTKKITGVIVVRDTQPDKEHDIVEDSLKPAVAVPAREEDDPEPPLPQPFRWP